MTIRRAKILVVDDDESMGVALQRLLRREHDLSAVTDARVALARIDNGEQFDVILCDLMMPLMTGMEFYQQLIVRHPDQVARIVFLSGGAFTARARSFLDEIPNARLEKPFELQTLRALINERLNQS